MQHLKAIAPLKCDVSHNFDLMLTIKCCLVRWHTWFQSTANVIFLEGFCTVESGLLN